MGTFPLGIGGNALPSTKGSLAQLINELMTKVFVEQPLASPGSGKN